MWKDRVNMKLLTKQLSLDQTLAWLTWTRTWHSETQPGTVGTQAWHKLTCSSRQLSGAP
ncbi:hypothetical protein TanjilG_30861 [Lupinus angustifolius]|uniref:Uncharacterized protein n=1 Tax=Lupinus angustifolius TaxID=3871 RepID=A0A1J7H9R7_LUPAN|nr:hypothetical protein TanjilG_30861 [Lupinus angustifolius]